MFTTTKNYSFSPRVKRAIDKYETTIQGLIEKGRFTEENRPQPLDDLILGTIDRMDNGDFGDVDQKTKEKDLYHMRKGDEDIYGIFSFPYLSGTSSQIVTYYDAALDKIQFVTLDEFKSVMPASFDREDDEEIFLIKGSGKAGKNFSQPGHFPKRGQRREIMREQMEEERIRREEDPELRSERELSSKWKDIVSTSGVWVKPDEINYPDATKDLQAIKYPGTDKTYYDVLRDLARRAGVSMRKVYDLYSDFTYVARPKNPPMTKKEDMKSPQQLGADRLIKYMNDYIQAKETGRETKYPYLFHSKDSNKMKDIKLVDEYIDKTRQGYEVIAIYENRSGRKFAIVERRNDFVLCAGYDTADGTWAQGYYDFGTIESALEYLNERYGDQGLRRIK